MPDLNSQQTDHTTRIREFIDRWQTSGAAERANFPQFAVELCDIINVPHPDPTTPIETNNTYVFEKSVPLPHGTTGRIDLYKRGCFVLEAKQGSDKTNQPATFSQEALRQHKQRKRGTAVRGTASWDTAMEKARQQAQSYARNLPLVEIENGRPPILIVVDVGNTIALYSEFSRTGGNYIPFPDPHSYRLEMADLLDANVQQLLHQVWTDPMSLDPSRRSARVTRDIATRLAQLAKSLEGQHEPEAVAQFLMRCLFTMFAEDVEMLPQRSFTQLLADLKNDIASFKPMVEHLWQTMNDGGFSVVLRTQIPQFNGGLFANTTAIPLTTDQLQLLIEAAQADWRDVEPAIFGTLLERALDPIDRHKLGAHYTPRAYVDRLVMPTVIEPLRAEWEGVQTAALLHADEGSTDKAIAEVETFHRRLATIRILDPACGSGNFLYVTLEHLKRLEGEVLNTLRELGEGQMRLEMAGITVSPQQFLGIEVNPRAAAIAELVLWIGYLQWHIRTRGRAPHAEPIIKDYHNIECRDAVLAWDAVEPLLDENGDPVTRWDGRSTKPHPVTGEQVPDDIARIPAYKYINPRPAEWPEADFIVGNPPFIGDKRMRAALGDGYVTTIRDIYASIPEAADYVMYWWELASRRLVSKKCSRVGFISTNSIKQIYNRRVLEQYLSHEKQVSLAFAIPDHPWVDSSDGADVRIAMVVAQAGMRQGKLLKVSSEIETKNGARDLEFHTSQGLIASNLSIGANVTQANPLKANGGLSGVGIALHGRGFALSTEEAQQLIARCKDSEVKNVEKYIRPTLNARDVTQKSRHSFVIDLFGLEEDDLATLGPIYQYLLNTVFIERKTNRRKSYRKYWWIFGEPRSDLRDAIKNLDRYIVSPFTAVHRLFLFLDNTILPDQGLVVIGSSDAFHLGVLSSSPHLIWVEANAGSLGVFKGNIRYNKSRCFEPFPLPDATKEQKTRIRELAEQLDAHRKRQLAQHPKLTMTGMYNVLQKLRTAAQVQGTSEVPRTLTLTPKEREIHEQGLVSILQQLHDDLDTAVFDAYGWPPTLTDEQILENLVALNAERAAEEAQGKIRWLRPEYQAPDQVQPTQATLIDTPVGAKPALPTPAKKQPWPKTMAEQAQAIRTTLATFDTGATPTDIAAQFGKRTKARIGRITELLDTLVMLGQAREIENGKFIA